VRPYPTAIAGIPSAIAFDRASRTFDCTFSPRDTGPGDRASRTTVIEMPARQYPDGYVARVRGAWIDSPRCASRLVLRNKPRAASVLVHVGPRPAGTGMRACRRGVSVEP
jgi:hypothetical protein